MLFEGVRFQLTESAQAARDAYDLYSNPILGTCTAKGMPTIMEQPYPMELVEGDGVIYLKMEEGDSVREIYMTGESPLNTPSPLGTSVGHWGRRDSGCGNHREHMALYGHDGSTELRG